MSTHSTTPLRIRSNRPLPCVIGQATIWPARCIDFSAGKRFFGPKSDDFAGSRSVLWLGYRATNSIWSEQAALVSEQGLRFDLPSRGEDTLTNSEHLVNWEIPIPLTNHGNYRLILPKQNRTLLTFVYD